VDYEETGWYDGEVFVKPPEVLTRDRLLGMYEVRALPKWAKLQAPVACGVCMNILCVHLQGAYMKQAAGHVKGKSDVKLCTVASTRVFVCICACALCVCVCACVCACVCTDARTCLVAVCFTFSLKSSSAPWA
jgi:hypothetical protein